MGPTAFFGTIYGFHCTISAIFYFYLPYFQQKNFSFSKISGSQTKPKWERGIYIRPPSLVYKENQIVFTRFLTFRAYIQLCTSNIDKEIRHNTNYLPCNMKI